MGPLRQSRAVEPGRDWKTVFRCGWTHPLPSDDPRVFPYPMLITSMNRNDRKIDPVWTILIHYDEWVECYYFQMPSPQGRFFSIFRMVTLSSTASYIEATLSTIAPYIEATFDK